MAGVRSRVRMRHNGAVPEALRCDVRIDVAPGRAVEAAFVLRAGTLVLFGPTGAGKTVTLRALAGLMRPARGTSGLGGEVGVDTAAGVFVPPQDRGVGYTPQHTSLFPHLSVRENLAIGRRGRPTGEDGIVAALDLGALLDRRPASLSGGERQRVALGRALARGPRLLLLDEPLSALHLPERRRIVAWLSAWAHARGTPVVFVTHDPEEATSVGDHLVLMDGGRTVAEGQPDEILRR